MAALRKILGFLSCSFLLCVGLGLSDVTLSAESKMSASEKTIIGVVLRIEGNGLLVVKNNDGKEVHLYMDTTTKMKAAGITVGDGVMAKIDDHNHVDLLLADQKNRIR